MKERIRGIIVGIVLGITIATSTALAITGTIQKELWYNNIKITLDNKEIKPTDANGIYVEPFIIDGTTYLPVRGIANALGMDVQWDNNTNTVNLFNSVTSPTISETVIFNKNGIKITADRLSYNKDSFASVLELTITNNMNIELEPYHTVLVNGIKMGTAVLYPENQANEWVIIPPQSTIKANIGLSAESLELLGINQITDIVVGMDLYDTDFNNYCSVPSTSIKTSANTSFKEHLDISEFVMWDKNGIRVIAKKLIKNQKYYELLMYIENNSTETLEKVFTTESFGMGSVCLNGKKTNYFFTAFNVHPGQRELTSFIIEPIDVNGIAIEGIYSIEISNPFIEDEKSTIFVDSDGNIVQ